MRRALRKVAPAAPIFMRPGSDEARRAGCRCSMIANYFGRGVGDERHPLYEISKDCIMHASLAPLAGSGQEPVHV